MSLEDQMVDRLLFYDWTREMDDYLNVNSKVGWNPFPGLYRQLRQAFPGRTLATDCSAFDWTVPAWLFALVLDLKISQTQGLSNRPDVQRAMRSRFREVLGDSCVIRLPDGNCYRQLRSGLMKSGWLLTIAANSSAQAFINMVAYRAAGYPGRVPLLWTMGDDLLMDWQHPYSPKPLVEWVTFLGLKIKFYSSEKEFSGFNFDHSQEVRPLYKAKHLYLLQHTPLEKLREMADAYGLLYALSEDSEMWATIEPYATYPRWYYRDWARGLGSASVRLPEDLMASLKV